MLEKIRDQIKAAVPRLRSFNIAVNAQGETARAYGKLVERRESNPASSMILVRIRGGIAQRSAIFRGRRVAAARYLARRSAIPRQAWTNGTIDGPRAGQNRPPR